MTLSLFSVGKTCRVVHGDSSDVLRRLAPNSIEAMVTDPPAGLDFMSIAWDSDRGGRNAWVAWLRGIMELAFVVMKPGAYGLVWALPKRSHWTAWALEDAGFEIHDVHHHIHGEGMPKMGDVGKLIDKHLGAERTVIRTVAKLDSFGPNRVYGDGPDHGGQMQISAPATPEAARWTGWSAQLKPSVEHWILCRKPLDGTYAENVLKYGTGVMNIDGCRSGTSGGPRTSAGSAPNNKNAVYGSGMGGMPIDPDAVIGRWPAHLSMDEAGAALLDEQSGVLTSGAWPANRSGMGYGSSASGTAADSRRVSSEGGASRFFYVAKATRDEKTMAGLVDNDHETVKSIALMVWLIRLISPPGATILDPFCGSGTTGLAAAAEGFSFLGIEQDTKHHDVARRRLELAYSSVGVEL